ncbi:MAG: Phytochrome-like protein cph2 [Tenericutes bacterium ADurb.Bin024]|nr:MAG: Phytochrome-like protein cph2 [Tenericutes bacterium ADurb.Bin024]
MISGQILVVSNNVDTKIAVKNALAKDFTLYFSTPTEMFDEVKKHRELCGVIFELKDENIQSVEQFTRLYLTYPRLKLLVLASREFYESIDEEARFGFWCMETSTADDLLKKVYQLKEYPLSTIEKISLVDAAFERAPFGLMIIPNDHLELALFNRTNNEIIGYTGKEYAKLGLNKNTHPDDVQKEIEVEAQAKERGDSSYNVIKRIIKKDGSVVWVEQFISIVESKKYEGFSRIIITWDVSNQKIMEEKLRESDRSRASLLENLPGMAYRSLNDKSWTMAFVSDGALALTGYRPEELKNNHIVAYYDLIVSAHKTKVRHAFNEAAKSKKTFHQEYEIITKNGTKKWVSETSKAVFDNKGNLLFFEGIIVDINHLKKIEKQLKHFQQYDQKLNLPNRKFLIDKIQSKLDKNNYQGTIILVNLKESQKLYRSHGYQYMELLTASLVTKLKTIETSRIGLHYAEEDLFVFYAKYQMTREEIKKFYARLRSAIGHTISREQIRSGVGVAFLNKNITIAEVYLQRARIASEYIDDENALISLHIYNDVMEQRVKREEYLRQELIAVSYEPGHEHKLRLVFQPIINLQTGGVRGFEALARFNSDKYGPISPLEFIPIVENNRLIIAFGKKVINLAIAFVKELLALGVKDCGVAINISVLQLLDPSFAEDLFLRIESAGVPAEMIMIEMTESIFSTNYELLSEALAEIREYGIDTAIDDFGTGFSSLARIEKLHFNTVKMDRVFVAQMNKENATHGIAQDIINICKKFNIKSLAEGIETEEQYNALKGLGCEFGQGFYMSRPLEVEDAKEFIKKQKH